MKKRNTLWWAVGLVILFVILALGYSYRYLLLSRLHISTSENGGKLGLHLVKEIPLPGSATRFDYQSIDSQDGLLFIAHLGADQIDIVNLNQERVSTTIPDISSVHGVLFVPEKKRLYAAATGNHQVAVIDIPSFQVIARSDGGDYPDGLAYDPENQKLFVSDESGGGVIVIDTKSNQRIGRIDLGGEVGNTQYDPTGHQIISAAQGKNQLDLIDPQLELVKATIELPGCDGPHGFTIDSPKQIAYVSCERNAALETVDIKKKQVTTTDRVGEIPDVLVMDTGLNRLYVAAESGVVADFRIDGPSPKKIGQSYLAPNAHSIAVDPQTHLVYVPLENIGGHPLLRIYEPYLNIILQRQGVSVNQQEIFQDALRHVAELCAVAAMTAPKSGGQLFLKGAKPFIETVIVEDKPTLARLAAWLRDRGERLQAPIWLRDAETAEKVDLVLFIGLAKWYPPVYDCGACGYATCAEFLRAREHQKPAGIEDWEFPGPICQLRAVDLGIAVGSAAKIASLNNIDTRCQTRIAAAARHLGVIQADLAVALSMSVSHKNIFFDRQAPTVAVNEQK